MSVSNQMLDQQDYYFFLLQDSGGYSINNYWNQIGDTIKLASFEFAGCEIQHRKIQSFVRYFRGDPPEFLTSDGKGNPPFLYDLIAFKTMINSKSFLVFSFPFAVLARDSLLRVNQNSDFKRKTDFLKTNVPILVKQYIPINDPEQTVRIVGLRVNLSEKNKTLTSVSLTGNNPIDSDVYKTFFYKPVMADKAIPKNCILFFEVAYPTGTQQGLLTSSRLRSRIHIDSRGNFRFYVHLGGANFCIILSLIKYLETLGALEVTSAIPLATLTSEED